MNVLVDFLHNKIILGTILACCCTQILKVFTNLIVAKSLDFRLLISDGGMPSSHSATVTSLATLVGLNNGFGSVEFAVALFMAIIVMHDAKGVRLEAGKHAKRLKEIEKFITDSFDLVTNFSETKLKEIIGHTPLQVYMGALFGILEAICFYYLVG